MIFTVTGPIDKEDLGITLSHEHIASDYSDSWMMYFYRTYDDEKIEYLYEKLIPVFENLYNVGIRTIFEASNPLFGQNLKLMYRLSKISGINIVANTGMSFFKHVYHIHKNFDEGELANRWINDFYEGIDKINGVIIRPSQIKLIVDNSLVLSEIDKKILKAAIIASKETGLPINCQVDKAICFEQVIDVLEEENFDCNRFLWSHAGNEANLDIISKALYKGIWIGFDQIKPEYYFKYCFLIKEAINYRYKDKIILSQDYDFYEELNKNKHNIYSSLITHFIPYCEKNGIEKELIIDILTKNPSEFFDIKLTRII